MIKFYREIKGKSINLSPKPQLLGKHILTSFSKEYKLDPSKSNYTSKAISSHQCILGQVHLSLSLDASKKTIHFSSDE